MTISTSTSRGDYAGNGSTTSFVVPFYFLADSHIKVISTDSMGVDTVLVLSTDYTVTGAGVPSGGSITTTLAPSTGYHLSILRNVPFTQEVDYQANDPFPAETHERALDKLTMATQQLNASVERAMTLPLSITGVSTQLPAPSPSKGLKWATDGLSVVNTDNDPDLASVYAAAAQASAGNAAASAVGSAASLSTFLGIYYGIATADPSLDRNGNAIGAGDLYFNSSTGRLRLYTGSSWQDTATASPASFNSNLYNGTGAQTAFTLSTTPASTASIFVFVSGVAQRPTTDYSVSGTTLTFTSAPPTGTNNVLAFVASTVSAGAPDNASVSTAKIQDGAVTLAKLLSTIYGTSGANKLLQLDATGKIPALDGSQITGIITMPVGSLIDFAGTSAPAGYLACPTTATNISRTTYAALFAAIGTTWGAGDGSTTFGLPWFAADYAAVQSSGNVGTATVGQVIAHTHTVANTYGAANQTLASALSSNGGTAKSTGSTGGTANLAAGVRVLKCIKY